jgi:hypothetical protein
MKTTDEILREFQDEGLVADELLTGKMHPKDPETERTTQHAMAEDWEHFLSYSGMWREPEEIKSKLLQAFHAAWEPSQPARHLKIDAITLLTTDEWVLVQVSVDEKTYVVIRVFSGEMQTIIHHTVSAAGIEHAMKTGLTP